jgi:glycosyltransferase involved in cell wall biosynthesis
MAKSKTPELIDQFISVVVVTDSKSRYVDREVKALSGTLKAGYTNYEIIVVDNNLAPAETVKLTDLLKTVACVRVIQLSREYSKDVCVFTGLESAIGDVVIIKSVTDPVPLIKKFIAQVQTRDLVFGISTRRIRAGLINNYGAKLFYWYNRHFLDIYIPERSTYFMAFSRRAVNAITRSRQHARHIRYLARQVGYKSSEIFYEPNKRSVPEKKRVSELLVSALELSTNYSKSPLRFVSWVGFAVSILNLVYAIYVVSVKLFVSNVAQGWTTLSLQASIMFFFLFAILAVLCEYIGQILQESRQQPPYHIADELNSKVSVADATRRNIMH